MSLVREKQEALIMRQNGESFGVIAKTLNVSKSTISLWCRKIKLTQTQKDALRSRFVEGAKKGRVMAAITNKALKRARIDRANQWSRSYLTNITERDFVVLGVALYWAEGSKKEGKLSFVNSDAEMILLMARWFRLVFDLEREDFMPRIFINEIHRPRIGVVIKYWSDLLKLPESQFGNPVFIKTKQKKKYENYDSYYGLLALRFRKSKVIKYKILGLIDVLKNKLSR